jgi:diguanylate cyclase (GGDEF)-like protein
LKERATLTEWEEQAQLREQADPRRRAVVQERMDLVLASQLPTIMGVAALLYLLTAGWHLVRLGDEEFRLLLVGSSLLVFLLAGVGALRYRGRPVPAERAHPLSLGILALLVVDGSLHLALSRDPIHSTGFMLLLMACGAFLTDLRWTRGAMGLVLGTWMAVTAAFTLTAPTLPHFAVGILLSLILASLIANLRIGNLRRMESLNLELEGLIGLDGLTGIANRRAFEHRLGALWGRLRRDRAPLALIYCDLDHFKNLNDTRGHSEGDAALRQVGGILRFAVRTTDDLPARLGGEEFAILLPRTTRDQALLVAERIRQAIAFARIPNPGAPTGETLTMSLGIAVAWPSARVTPESLMDRADNALYRAKTEGRNRAVVDEGRSVPEPAGRSPGVEGGLPPVEPPSSAGPGVERMPEPNPLDRPPPFATEPRGGGGGLPRPTDDPFWVPPSPDGGGEDP